MHRRTSGLTALAAALLLGPVGGAADAPVEKKPFPQPGSAVPDSFCPYVVNGPWKDNNDKPVDRYHSIVCHYGLRPVVLVLARDPKDEAVLDLVKKLDAALDAHKRLFIGGAAIFLCHDEKREDADLNPKDLIKIANEKEKLVEDLKEKAKTAGLKHFLLGIDGPAGPKKFALDRKVDVMVVAYDKFVVKASHTYERGGLDDKAVAQILKDVEALAAGVKKKPVPRRK